MSTLAYPARIWRDDEGFYQVEFPDVPGAVTYGETEAEARTNAIEALTGVLGAMFDDGTAIPRPSVGSKNGTTIQPEPDVAMPILLRWAREEAALTQGQLATRMGISQQAYQKLERAGGNPSIKTLAKVARALGRELRLAL